MIQLDPPPQIRLWDWIWRKWLNNLYEFVKENSVASYDLNVSRGLVTGVASLQKFGRCSNNVDNGTATDIWDGAVAAVGTITYIAPTAARIHQIVSTSTSDDGDPVGVGARTIKVFGLTGWAAAEVSETITLNGQTNVPTVNAYVIIHRMYVVTKGATNINVGTITATADTDGTVSAYILAGNGQTLMAVYGVPSTHEVHLTGYYAAANRSVAGSVNIKLLYNSDPDVELLNFRTRHTLAVNSAGNTDIQHTFKPHLKFDGPGILKVEGTGSANNMDVSAGFAGYLVTK